MTRLPRFVVDASVATKWHLEDEEDTDQALALLTDYCEGRIALLALWLGDYRSPIPR